MSLARRLASLAELDHPAIEDDVGAVSFRALFAGAQAAKERLLDGERSLEGRRVVLFASPGAAWVEAFVAIVLAGGVAVPLSARYPATELAWFAADSGADTVIRSADFVERAASMTEGRRVLDLAELTAEGRAAHATIDELPDGTALFLYTSGTTGKPKGAMITRANIAIHAEILHEAWAMSSRDVLLHALPLHHLHGLGISLLNAFLAGATTRMLPKFDAERVWEALGGATVWMAVPTMYQKLFEAFDRADDATRARWAANAKQLRLATSGSAALPVTLAEKWRAITGAIPLERFGMTEIGVGATNPLTASERRAGTVGRPPSTVEIRIVDEGGRDLDRGPGELWVRGPSLFAGYFGRDDATRAAFEGDWFKTGDVAECDQAGYVKLLGRTSVDILKSGGYKLSALEIEEALREHNAIAEVAVVGLPDETWGDRVVAAIVPARGREEECAASALRAWAKERMAAYKVPREVVVLSALPRNPMGKVMKPELVKQLLSRHSSPES